MCDSDRLVILDPKNENVLRMLPVPNVGRLICMSLYDTIRMQMTLKIYVYTIIFFVKCSQVDINKNVSTNGIALFNSLLCMNCLKDHLIGLYTVFFYFTICPMNKHLK